MNHGGLPGTVVQLLSCFVRGMCKIIIVMKRAVKATRDDVVLLLVVCLPTI